MSTGSLERYTGAARSVVVQPELMDRDSIARWAG
jgi:hypothetical protein